jgi:hypothetical protein
MPGAKQDYDRNCRRDAERSDLSGPEHGAIADMAVPARFQAGQTLKLVAWAGEEEVVNAVRDGERQWAPKEGSDRPLRPVLRFVARNRDPFRSIVVSRREDDIAEVRGARSGDGGGHPDVEIRGGR